jgi:hypothetical protein
MGKPTNRKARGKRILPTAESSDSQATESNALVKLLQMVEATREIELSCDEVSRLLDQFAEIVYQGEDVTSIMPLVKNHVELCPECKEELEALLRILQNKGS